MLNCLLEKPPSCPVRALKKRLLIAALVTLVQPVPQSFAIPHSTESAALEQRANKPIIVKVSSARDTIKGRPLINNWDASHQPVEFDNWPQDKQALYMGNQEHIRTLIHQIRHMRCSRLPCLIAKDYAEQLYDKSRELKQAQERDLESLEATTQGAIVTSIALGVIFTSAGIATFNPALISAGIAINITHFAASQLITQSAFNTMKQNLGRAEAMMASEQEELREIAQKLKTVSGWVAEARSKILFNLAMEHGGQVVYPKMSALGILLQENWIHGLEEPVTIHKDSFAESFADDLENLPENEVFALSFIARFPKTRFGEAEQIKLAFKAIPYKNRFYISIPHPSENLILEFSQSSRLLAFFTDFAGYHQADHILLMIPVFQPLL
ncbi:hypothetical protein [Sansalvadorimonas verongulae]|uniref:hypothetical protein n=1 Tax=Sansalvadorimonas verongulae TaxID=2172824 RepID=UPI0012BCFCE2|nr:hypothetical protein [Sansalvadorimonas verongulae]MTI14699.1 hypothetical protein [Sansalvadorimonas verongulae]